MIAKCIRCNKYWNISVKHKIDHAGYICPVCRYKERKTDNNKKSNIYEKKTQKKNVLCGKHKHILKRYKT